LLITKFPLQVTLTVTLNKTLITIIKLQPLIIAKGNALIISLHIIIIEILSKLNIELVEDKDRITIVRDLPDIIIK